MLKPITREQFDRLTRGARTVGRTGSMVTYECRNGMLACICEATGVCSIAV